METVKYSFLLLVLFIFTGCNSTRTTVEDKCIGKSLQITVYSKHSIFGIPSDKETKQPKNILIQFMSKEGHCNE